MDNQNKPDTEIPQSDLSPNQELNNSPNPQPQAIVNQLNPVQPSDTKNNNDPMKINKTLLVLLVATFLVSLSVGALLIGDIKSGVLQGKAETGFGVLFAIFLSPVLIALAVTSFIKIHRVRSQGIGVSRTVKLAVVITVVLSIASLAYEIGISKYEDYAHRGEHAQLQRAKDANKPESITITYATELLNSCKLKNVDTGTNDTSSFSTEVRNSAEGVVLVKVDGKPNNIRVTDKAYGILKPAIDNANKNCPSFRKS